MKKKNKKRLSDIAVQIVYFEKQIEFYRNKISILKKEITDIMAERSEDDV